MQRTPEWFAARLGKVTASRIGDVMATIQKGEAQSRKNYRSEKVLERWTQEPQERGYTNSAMQYGIETEAEARAMYALDNGVAVEEVGFLDHPKIENAGASPDGLIVDSDGLVEIKCPEPSGYLDAKIRGEDIDDKYIKQMQFQMAVTGRNWCDYVVYRKGCPLAVQRIHRDDNLIRKIEDAVIKFLFEVDNEYRKLCDTK